MEKFIGDAVVGMFGVPEAHEDDALRACRAALEILERVDALNAGIAVRIGVNTGEVVAGDAALREMFASGRAVVLGDSVNVAARLEQAAAPGEVLIGEATYRLVAGAVAAEPVEPIAAKGKAEPLRAYRLSEVSEAGPVPRRSESVLVGREAELGAARGGVRRLEARLQVGHGRGRCRRREVAAGGGAVRAGRRPRPRRAGRLPLLWRGNHLLGDRSDRARAPEPRRVAERRAAAASDRTASRSRGGASTADQTARAIASFLAAAASERPLVVLVDDIHWAEPACSTRWSDCRR